MARLKPLGKREIKKLGNTPVRKCNEECFFFKNGGNGCDYFSQGDVQLGELCMFDLVKLKEYSDAFSTGDTEVVKKDASNITAMVMMQVQNMLQQVAQEGSTVDEPILDAKGAVVYIPEPGWTPNSGYERQMVPAMRMKEHPLISRAIQLAKSMGVNLSEFKLTPKSADEKAQVAGHIIVDKQLDMKDVMDKRLETEEKFLKAVSDGNKLTREDPVFLDLLENGDIMDE